MDPAALLSAMTRRLLRRAAASGRIVVPAVPSMLEAYVEMCDAVFAGIGVEFSAADLDQLRAALQGQLDEAFAASPRSEIVITYESPIGRIVNYRVHAHTADVAATYDTWVTTRSGPLFGTEPDAKVLAVAVAAGEPSACAVLDIGAGTGRNALTLAHRGHPVDAIELSPRFAAVLREEAVRRGVSVRVLERDLADTQDDLRNDYGLIVMSEVASDFRSVDQLYEAFGLASKHLAPKGIFVANVFVTRHGYEPDPAAFEFAQQCYSTMFTPQQVSDAAAAAGLCLRTDESVLEFEKSHLPQVAWPPTDWFEDWVTGRDVFDLPNDDVPVELRWLTFERQDSP